MMAVNTQSDGPGLAELLAGFADEKRIPDMPVYGLANDSRHVKQGDVFFAVAGYNQHGLEHVDDAILHGASAIVWEPTADIETANIKDSIIPCIAVTNLNAHLSEIASRYYGNPSSSMHCIGVTGTDGKTSVSHFIAQALQTNNTPCGLLGTLGYGVFGDLEESSHTTPDALRTQLELAKLRDRDVSSLVMEVSSHALDQGRVSAVQFDSVILTNLSRDHLDYHGSLESYAEAKSELFHFSELQNAVINLDDAFGISLLDSIATDVNIIGYSINPDFNSTSFNSIQWLHASAIKLTSSGMEVTLNSSWGDTVFVCQLIGHFNVENLLATAGALLASGLSFAETVKRLQLVHSVPGRMEMLGGDNQPLVIIDYAHTPNALKTALVALKPYSKAELIVVFGAGGDRDQGKRPEMGQAVEKLADRIVLTSDNPRNEKPEQILNDIAEGIVDDSKVVKIEDREEAIGAAIETADEHDVILIAGKGNEQTQQTGDRFLSFSDRVQVIEALKRWQE